MIHQLIFANPKPGMSAGEFHDYWLNVHAVQYAGKIKQIVRYKINTVIPLDGQNPLYQGVAEIWLRNEEEQLASLQSAEFIDGARKDEPNWAAFWQTIGLDTDTHVIDEGGSLAPDPAGVKLLMLVKRKEGVPLGLFRDYSLKVHGPLAQRLPGLRGYYQCHARDSLYAVGESRFDAAYMMWFDNPGALEKALESEQYKQTVYPDLLKFAEEKYLFKLQMKEHWIIGPEIRE